MAVEVRIVKCKLRDRRLAAGYTQDQLAKLVGVTKSRISEYESELKDVHITTAIKFCVALNCNINDIFTFEIIRNQSQYTVANEEVAPRLRGSSA